MSRVASPYSGSRRRSPLQRVPVLMTPDEIAEIDRWGVKHVGNRAAAIRALVKAGLRVLEPQLDSPAEG